MHKFVLSALVCVMGLPAYARVIRVDAFDCRGPNMVAGTQQCWDAPSLQNESTNSADWGTLGANGQYRPLSFMKPTSTNSIIKTFPAFVGPSTETRFNVTGTGSFVQTANSTTGFGGSYFTAFDLLNFFEVYGNGYNPAVYVPSLVRSVLKPEFGLTDITVAWGLQNTNPDDTSDTRFLNPANNAQADPDDLQLFRVTWSFDNLRQVLVDQAHYTLTDAEALLQSIFELDAGNLHFDAFNRPVPTVQLISGLSASGDYIVELTGLKTTRFSSAPMWNGANSTCFDFRIGSGGEPLDSCPEVINVPEPPALLLTVLALGLMATVAKRKGWASATGKEALPAH